MWIKKSIRWTLILSVVALISGCAANGNYCDIAKPIWWDSEQQLDATPAQITRQIVMHNETVAALCPKRAVN